MRTIAAIATLLAILFIGFTIKAHAETYEGYDIERVYRLDGTLEKVLFRKNGEIRIVKTYRPDGSAEEIFPYKNGKLNGYYAYLDETEQLIIMAEMVNNEIEGKLEIYMPGTDIVMLRAIFTQSRAIAGKCFPDDPKISRSLSNNELRTLEKTNKFNCDYYGGNK